MLKIRNFAALTIAAMLLVFTSCDPRKMVTGVTLNTAAEELEIGGTVTLTASIAPADAYDQVVTWTSSDPSIASVSGTGATVIVTANKAGTAIITVTTQDGGLNAACTVTVKASAPVEETGPYAGFYNYPDGKKDQTGTLTLTNNMAYAVLCFTDSVDAKNYICEVPASGSVKVKLAKDSFYNIVTVAKKSYETDGKMATQTTTMTYYSDIQGYNVKVSAEELSGGATWIFNNYTNFWVAIENVDGSGDRFAVIKPQAQRVAVPVSKKNYDYKVVYMKELKINGISMGISEKTTMAENDTAPFATRDTFTTDLTGEAANTNDDLAPTIKFINNTNKTIRVYNGQIQLCNAGEAAVDYALLAGDNAIFTGISGESSSTAINVRSNAWIGAQNCTEDITFQNGKVYVMTAKASGDSAKPITWEVTEKDVDEVYDVE